MAQRSRYKPRGLMKSANLYVFRSSKPCLTCEDLRRLRVRIEAALGNARNLYRAAIKTTDSPALQNPEEEFKQTSAAHNFVCYAVEAHLTNQHTQARGDRLAA